LTLGEHCIKIWIIKPEEEASGLLLLNINDPYNTINNPFEPKGKEEPDGDKKEQRSKQTSPLRQHSGHKGMP
jgi:hypothetical protein